MPAPKSKESTRQRLVFPPFVLQLLAAALQENKASLFVNVTHSRLKLMSFGIFAVLGQLEANFHYFTFYLHSTVVLRNEYIR